MKLHFINSKNTLFTLILSLIFGSTVNAQTPVTTITDYVIFGGTSSIQPGQTAPASPGYGVQVGYSGSIQGGSVGSYKLVKSVGNMAWGTSTNKTNIYSGGTVVLANSNVVTGKITAGIYNTAPAAGTIFSAGTSETLNGPIDINGNIVIRSIVSGTTLGTVTNPTTSTYKLGNVTKAGTGTPTLAILPQAMPIITTFPASRDSNITTTTKINPGAYGNVTIGGNSTLTLNGPGTYVFKSITTTGPNSNIVFDAKSNTTGNFLIYVYGDVLLNRTSCTLTNGAVANHIFTELHGTGSTNTLDRTVAFSMSNGSNGTGNTSGWFGSVWAPYAAIKIGAPNGPSMAVLGALWSGTQVNLGDGVTIIYAPFSVTTCASPAITTQPTAPAATCAGSGTQTISVAATGTGLTYSWRKAGVAVTNGGTVSGQGTSTLTLTNPTAADAGSYDVVVSGTCGSVTSTAATVTVYALPTISGTLNVCVGSTTTLTGTGIADALTPWISSNTSVATISSTGVVTPVGIAGGTSVITYKNSNGCTATATVTVNPLPSIIDAGGPDKPYNFDGITTIGNPNLTGFNFKWTAPPGGLITTPDDQASISVAAPGIYKLALKSAAGCTSTDDVLVSNKVKSVIGSELTSIYWNNPTGLPSPFFIISKVGDAGYVRIDVIVNVGNYAYVLDLLQQTAPINYGLINIVTNGENGEGKKEIIITGDFPIANLLKLNDLGDFINYCRPFYEATTNSGLVNSAGDTTMRSNLVRTGYKIDGSGIKVGIISNSFATITSGTTTAPPFVPVPGIQSFTTNTAAQDLSNGDLGPVTIVQDYAFKSTDELRAMAQIVHDVAPGAEIYARTGYYTAGDFATGIKQLAALGCKVIVDDLTYFTEPYLKDGVVAKAVDEVKAQGVTYFSAAGNFGNKSYEKDFKPADATAAGFSGKMAHDFSNTAGTVDIFQHVTLPPGNYTIVLQWVDNIYSNVVVSNGQVLGTHFDVDMFWRTYNAGGTFSEWKGFNRDNTDGDPLEMMPFTINTTTDADFLILNNNTDGNPARIKYVIYRGDVQILEYNNEGTSTLVGQANAAGAIAVGASRYDKAPPYLSTPLIESFSSIGGTQTEGVVRQKPDIVGPDGVNTTVKMGQDYPNSALDGYSNFFGTSAAAPHAAAVAALIMQGKKKFLNQDPSLSTPDDIRSLLRSTAVDMETANNLPGSKFDYISGYGLVDADSAMRTFAAPTATLIELVVPSNIIPCSGDSFTVTITGENFSRNTVVYLIKGPGDSTIITPTFINSSAVSVKISSCVGNPELKAYTPPKAGTNGKDGGFSNSKYFFSAYVTVDAVSINKKYSETLVKLDTVIRVNGKLLQDTTLTLQDIGLASMTVTTAATDSSDVGTYAINVTRVFDPTNTADAAFLKSYNYKFTNGTVTIAKMPLRVTPEPKMITYGQNIGKVTFKYDFDKTNVHNPDSVTNVIKAYHDVYLPKNALAVVKGFKKQQINGSILDTTSLRNMNMIASFNAVKNSRKFTLWNNALVPITDPAVLQDNLSVQYLVDIASESIFDYKSNPATTQFYPGYPGINPKALLSASSIESDDITKGTVANTATKITNGLLSQAIFSIDGPIVPMVNGLLVQVVDAIEDGTKDTVQYLSDGSWVKLSNTAQKVLNSSLKIANTTSVKITNGIASVLLPDGVTYAPIEVLLNSTPLKITNGTVQKVVNGQDVTIPDGSYVRLEDGGLVEVKNASFAVVANSAVKVLNSSGKVVNTASKVVNSSLKIANTASKVVNSSALGTDAPNNNTAVILDSQDGIDDGSGYSGLGAMYGINMITGLEAGTQYMVPGTLVDPNFDISYGLGVVNIVPAIITVTAGDTTRQYGDNNPSFRYTYSGFVNNEDSVTSGIKGVSGTGIPSVSTAATQISPAGNYDIVVSQGGLVSGNYSFSFVKGILTITSNPCLVAPNTATNFGSTPSPFTTPISLWLNLTTKVSGQLVVNGDYLLFKAGSITLTNITSTAGNLPIAIPNGKIVADNSVSSPVTNYDAGSNTWITKVPLGFASTSDIFVTGAIINSNNGFKKGNNASTSVKGAFYSNKYFKDQWTYASAAYQLPSPTYTFKYADIDGITKNSAGVVNAGVVAINGTYRAGTPLPVIAYLKQGGSGGGGNNYTGSTASFSNFTACLQAASYVSRGIIGSSSTQQVVRQDITTKGEMQLYPNPASGNITLSYIPRQTGTSKITIMSVDGKRVMETYNGVWEAGKKYVRRIDVSGLTRGVYMIQVTEKDSMTNKKMIIGR